MEDYDDYYGEEEVPEEKQNTEKRKQYNYREI